MTLQKGIVFPTSQSVGLFNLFSSNPSSNHQQRTTIQAFDVYLQQVRSRLQVNLSYFDLFTFVCGDVVLCKALVQAVVLISLRSGFLALGSGCSVRHEQRWVEARAGISSVRRTRG